MKLNHDVSNLNRINKSSIKISDNSSVTITEFRKNKNLFYDVIFKNNETEKFIGRYNKISDNVKVKYILALDKAE